MPRLSPARRQLLDAMMKDAIYEAAVTVLAEHGVDGVTMDRVAAAAGLGKGSLYNYFEGKQDLLQMVHAKAVAPINQAVEELLARPMPAADKLRAVVRVVFEHLGRQRALHLLLKDDAVRMLVEPSRRSNREVAIAHFAAVFRQGIAEGAFRPIDPIHLARMFFGALRELWDCPLATGQLVHHEELIAPLLTVFLEGIRA